MQTWAKRGVQAALVTGGMIAAGTGVASASGTCPDRPASPWGESALTPATDDGTPRHSGPCFAGELFPDESHIPGNHDRSMDSRAQRSAGQKTAISGTLDPVRDLLPAMENDVTREMPVLTEQFWHSPQPPAKPRASTPRKPLELAGWIADTVDSPQRIPLQPNALLTRPAVADTPAIGTPAEGFQRSLSWAGPIGDVIKGLADTLVREPVATPGNSPELVVPTGDPAVAEGFDQVEGIVALWEGTLGRGGQELADGLVSPGDLDLTSGELPGPATRPHMIPRQVLASALSTLPRAVQAPHEFVPLQVPGELQEQAAELPDLSRLVLLDVSKAGGTLGRGAVEAGSRQENAIHETLPGLGELRAFDSAHASMPAASRITQALGSDAAGHSANAGVPRFSRTPELSPVTVHVADELLSALPPEQQVTQNPFGTVPRAASHSGMALPVLGDGGIPNIAAMQEHTLPMHVIDSAQPPLLRKA